MSKWKNIQRLEMDIPEGIEDGVMTVAMFTSPILWSYIVVLLVLRIFEILGLVDIYYILFKLSSVDNEKLEMFIELEEEGRKSGRHRKNRFFHRRMLSYWGVKRAKKLIERSKR